MTTKLSGKRRVFNDTVDPNNDSQDDSDSSDFDPELQNGQVQSDAPMRAQDKFENFMDGSINVRVDPNDCVPFTRIRKVVKCGVERLALIFDDEAESSSMSRGHSSSASLPLVVKLTPSQKLVVITYFMKDRNLTREHAEQRYRTRSQWYGIVDGSHVHAAFIHLTDKRPEKWCGYQWWVTIVQHHELEVLQAFARDRNDKQREEFMIDFTLYDLLRNMKEVATTYVLSRGEHLNPRDPRRGIISEIADAYAGGRKHCTPTTKQLAGVAIKLSDDVIACMGKIMNTEHPELLSRIPQPRNTPGTKRNRRDPRLADTRVFRKLFNTSTIRSAKLFKNTENDCDRIHALKRCMFVAIEDGLSSINGKQLDQQVKNSISARREVEKMEGVVGRHGWTPELSTVRANLLETTKLDEQVSNNTGEDRVLLRRLREVYLSHGGASASQRVELFQAGRLSENGEEINATQSNTIPITVQESPQSPNPNDQDTILPRNVVEGVSSDLPSNGTDDASIITSATERYGIKTYNMQWEVYQDAIVKSREHVEVDLILTDPPYCLPTSRVRTGSGFEDRIDEKEMEMFSQFARRVIKPGGYCVIFTSFHLYLKWKRNLEQDDFVVTNVPLILCKRTGLLQKSSSSRYPQNGSEFAIIARRKGMHPATFEPNFTAPYRLINCSHSRKFAIIDNVPPVRRKLSYPGTRRPVRMEEKNTSMLAEILNTYCPPNGSVLDAYGGTLTTALACLATDRKCIVIEKATDCYNLGLNRLESVAEMKRSQEGAAQAGNNLQLTIAASILRAAHSVEYLNLDEDGDDVDVSDQDPVDIYDSEMESSPSEGHSLSHQTNSATEGASDNEENSSEDASNESFTKSAVAPLKA